MNLYEKICALYGQEAVDAEASRLRIIIQNDMDGKGDYIAKWETEMFPLPTQEQLDSVPEPTPVADTQNTTQ